MSHVTHPLIETKPVIVIVEDDSDVSGVLRHFLEKEGFPVSVARDGEEALWVLRRVLARKSPLLAVVPTFLSSKVLSRSFLSHRQIRILRLPLSGNTKTL